MRVVEGLFSSKERSASSTSFSAWSQWPRERPSRDPSFCQSSKARALMRKSRSSLMVSPETEEGQHDKDDNDEPDNINYSVHFTRSLFKCPNVVVRWKFPPSAAQAP